MRKLFAASIVVGVLVAVLVWSLPLAISPRLELYVGVAGVGVAFAGALLWVYSLPAEQRARRLRLERPEALVLTCRRVSGIVDGLARARRTDEVSHHTLPGNFVLLVDRGGLEFWAGAGRVAAIDPADIVDVEVGALAQDSAQLALIIRVSADGLPSVLEISVGRTGWELWLIRDRAALERVRERVVLALADRVG